MEQNSVKGLGVAILATDGVEDAELTEPMNALKQAGAEVTLFAPKKGKIQSFKHHDKADHFDVDHSLADADVNKFDAVLLPGGAFERRLCESSRKLRSSSARWIVKRS